MTFEDAVQQLVALGYSRAVAVASVRAQHPHLEVPYYEQPKDENVLEKAEQVEVRKLLIAFGFKVRNLSQYRPSRVALGFPDLAVHHARLPIFFFFEVKRQRGGALSPAQVEFAEDCARCGIACYHGDRYRAVELLIDLEVAVRGAGPYGIEPVRHLTVAPS